MDKGDVEMLDAEKNVPASDVLVSKESPAKYENDVKTGKSNVEVQVNSKSQPEAYDNVVLENKTPTIDVGTDDMTSGYLKLTDDKMTDCEDNEGSLEDQTAFLGKLGTFYREKAMEFKPPRFYGHQLNCLKLWRFVIRLGGYDRFSAPAGRIVVKDLNLPVSTPGEISEGLSDWTIIFKGWQEQHLLGNGEVAEPIVKDRSANNTPKRAKNLKNTDKIVR
ncbi:hypothetical protein KY285_012256 [Solanum tuberosum]|nr:hypothetical protein KY285_012256 [Solanum tuberosum]